MDLPEHRELGLDEQVFLALEVVVQQALGDASLLGDRAHAGTLIALPTEDPGCGIEDARNAAGGPLGCGAGESSEEWALGHGTPGLVRECAVGTRERQATAAGVV